MKSAGIKQFFLGILVLCLVVFSAPNAGDAILGKLNALFNKISTPIEIFRAGRSFNRIEKVGRQIHNYSKEKERIGNYRADKIIKNAEAKYAAGQFSGALRDREIKRAKAIRNAYYEYARQIRRYGRSAGAYVHNSKWPRSVWSWDVELRHLIERFRAAYHNSANASGRGKLPKCRYAPIPDGMRTVEKCHVRKLV